MRNEQLQGSAVADKNPLLMNLPDLERQESGGVAVVSERGAKAPKSGAGKALPGKPFKPGVRTAGRQKGQPNHLTIGLREAVEKATQAGQCHDQGFAGWLVERAKGGIEDRKIFAGVVSRVIPLQVNQKSEGLVRIELGWLNGRDVGRNLAQLHQPSSQVIDIYSESAGEQLIKDQSAPDGRQAQAPAGTGQAGADGQADA